MKTTNFCSDTKYGLGLLGVALFLACGVAQAQDKKPEHEFSGNLGVVSDYRYRGLSQSRLQPALQGGVDYAHNPSGFYAGAWASTIKWTKDAGGSGDIELDIYGGKKGELTKDISYDVGLLGYLYPSNGLRPNANTLEIYGQLGLGPAYIKYSHALTNVFAFADSKNSGYLDLGANLELGGGYIANLHIGHQIVKRSSGFSYTDYKVGISKDVGFCNLSLAVIGTDSKAYVSPAGKNLGKTSLVLSASKTF